MAIAALLCSCGAKSVEPPDAGGDVFIAFASDFAGYTSWESFAIDGGIAQGASHLAGDRTVYLSGRPATGATEFPVRTKIVKVMTAQVFAMAKRGGGYNADGAVGWEWFELGGTPEAPYILWRGMGPPDGETYGGPGNSGCNNCHTGAWDNDFVKTPALQLSGF